MCQFFCFYICYFLLLCGIIRGKEVFHMNLHISKSKNAESFYICKSYVKANGSTSSMIVRKLGTLEQLLIEHGPTRDDVLAWAKNEVKIEEKEWALNMKGFKRVSDNKPADITGLPLDDKGLYYKDEPYTTKKLHQRLIITYSPKYALYQKSIRDRQVERAQKMLDAGNTKKNRKNPNDPAHFIGTVAATKEGEAADIHHYLDESKIEEEAKYDGFYAVCTDLLDDDGSDILKVSEGRWQIEECFRIMKTDFSARPVYLQDENRIKAHFLICFLALTIYRFLEKKLDSKYT